MSDDSTDDGESLPALMGQSDENYVEHLGARGRSWHEILLMLSEGIAPITRSQVLDRLERRWGDDAPSQTSVSRAELEMTALGWLEHREFRSNYFYPGRLARLIKRGEEDEYPEELIGLVGRDTSTGNEFKTGPPPGSTYGAAGSDSDGSGEESEGSEESEQADEPDTSEESGDSDPFGGVRDGGDSGESGESEPGEGSEE